MNNKKTKNGIKGDVSGSSSDKVKSIIIDVIVHEDGTYNHGLKSDFTLLETIGLLQVSLVRATEKFSEEA